MKPYTWWLLCLTVFPLCAGTIDTSQATTALLEPGDSLAFEILSWNYAVNAARYGLNLDPTGLSFTLISSPSTAAVAFEATLQSADGSFSQTLGAPLTFNTGDISSRAYSGMVSTLGARFEFSAQASQHLFGGASGASNPILTLRNIGPEILLGLPATTLQQDLFATLSGSVMTVGALHGLVFLEQATPEPQSGMLLMAGGGLLCFASRFLKRLSEG